MYEKNLNDTAAKAAKMVAAATETVVGGVKTAAKMTKEAGKTVKYAAETALNEVRPEIYVQYQSQECSMAAITKRAKESYIADGHKASDIRSLKIYLKPEERAAYYVVNEQYLGKVDLF